MSLANMIEFALLVMYHSAVNKLITPKMRKNFKLKIFASYLKLYSVIQINCIIIFQICRGKYSGITKY